MHVRKARNAKLVQNLQPWQKEEAPGEILNASEGFEIDSSTQSARSLLKSSRARASHHGRADMLAMHNSTPANDTQSVAVVRPSHSGEPHL